MHAVAGHESEILPVAISAVEPALDLADRGGSAVGAEDLVGVHGQQGGHDLHVHARGAGSQPEGLADGGDGARQGVEAEGRPGIERDGGVPLAPQGSAEDAQNVLRSLEGGVDRTDLVLVGARGGRAEAGGEPTDPELGL